MGKATGEYALFLEIHSERRFVSAISGRDLSYFYGSKKFVNCFAHIVSKNGVSQLVFTDKESKNRILRLNKENVMLLHPEEHHLVDAGCQEQRDIYEKKYPNADFSIFYDKKEALILEIKANESEFLR